MINLLGKESKAQIRAARMNVKLLRYNIVILTAVIAVLGVYAAGYILLMNEQSRYEKQVSNDQAEQRAFASTLNEAKAFNANLELADEILSNEITYSDLIIEIANVIPASSSLDDLTLANPEDVDSSSQEPTTVTFGTASFQSSLELKEALEASSLFEEVRLGEVTRRELGETPSQYEREFPFTVSVTLVFSEDTE